MATIQTDRAYAKKSFVGFGGIRATRPLDGGSARDVCNFRVLTDGTLRMREGYSLLTYFPSGAVTALWEGRLGERSLLLAVCGDTVWQADPDTLAKKQIGTLPASPTRADFCAFADTLLLFSDLGCFVITGNGEGVRPCEPYAPLYGLEWSPVSFGEIHEPINLLTPRLRVHYRNSGGETFYLPFYASSIDSVIVDGAPVTDFSFTKGSDRLRLSTAGSEVIVAFSVDLNTDLRQKLKGAKGYRHAEGGSETLLLFGAEGDCRIYPSREVTSAALAEATLSYPHADPLYVTSEDVLFAGESTAPVHTLCPFMDRVLALSERRAYLLWRDEEGRMTVETALGDFGAREGGVTPYGNDVVAVAESGVYRLQALRTAPDEITLSPLALFRDGRLPFSLAAAPLAHFERTHGELWICDRESESGEVWVLAPDASQWYRFDNIPAKRILPDSRGLTFTSGNVLFRFEKGLYSDNGNSVSATYESEPFDFDSPHRRRRSLVAHLCSNTRGAAATLSLQSERAFVTAPISGALQTSFPDYTAVHLTPHRHRFLRFSLSAVGGEGASFYKLLLDTNL